MLPRSTHLMATALSVTMVLAPFSMALAGTGQAARKPVASALPILPAMSCGGEYGGGNHGGMPPVGGGTNITINKPVNIYKPVTINKNINIYKPITINKNIDITKNIDNSKNIDIYKPITINKNIDITKNIDNSKNINITKNIDNSKNIEINKSIDNRKYIDNSKYISINKKIIINKGGSAAEASAMASAMAVAVAAAVASASASASVQNSININIANDSSSSSNASSYSNSSAYANANASARAGTIVYAGGSYETVTVNNYGAGLENIHVAQQKKCVYQEATVVKAIHAVCVSAEGREFAASHMTGDTWIESSYEGEVARCIAGSTLKVTIGQVVQSDQGMATTYGNGQVLMCGAREAVRHFKDGLLKCAPAVAVPDCTERTNLRLYGTGDMFFTFRTQVCAEIFEAVAESNSESYSRETEIQDLSLQGGVGGGY